MGLILKIIGVLTTLSTTVLLLIGTLRRGILLAGIIFGVLKVLLIVTFLALLLVVLYVLLTSRKSTDQVSTN
ncbi:MAG TPA: hypothetical protein VNQ79_04555 [Blastocatellia bacterium]|nr:hypothetical protein [Blastocatellia bacterium]